VTAAGQAIRAVRLDTASSVDHDAWPATVPAVAQILRDGIEFEPGLTFLVGENGSGKSTVVELLAEACGMNPQGGSAGSGYLTRVSEPGLAAHLVVERGIGRRPRWSYFLRADTSHGFYSYLEDNPGLRPEPRFHELSHGEGFLAILRTRVNQPGFYLMDEPDSPLSFTATLGLVGLLHELAGAGSQAIVATHSPVLAAVSGATILELGDRAIGRACWEDLGLLAARQPAPMKTLVAYTAPSLRSNCCWSRSPGSGPVILTLAPCLPSSDYRIMDS
jgi:predicted ATPase